MMEMYKEISIIYGNSGRSCAVAIAEKIQSMHLQNMFPIRPHILADEILDSGTILDKIKGIISKSAFCVIILTFDDVDYTRVRQNVLVEIGMAASCIDRENCFYITERLPLPEDFPSDLRSSINPNLFDKNNLDEVVTKIWNMMKKRLTLTSNLSLLTREEYDYDFRTILNDVPPHILEEPAEEQMGDILRIWTEHMKSFDFVSERLMYLAERIVFFPTIKNNDLFFVLAKQMEQMLKPSERDFETQDNNWLRTMCDLMRVVMQYTVYKVNPNVLSCNGKDGRDKIERRKHANKFSHYADQLSNIVKNIEDNIERECNWLVKAIAYDFAALAKMKSMQYSDCYDENTLNMVIGWYKKVISISEQSFTSDELWKGYAFFNLARAYEMLYELTEQDELIDNMEQSLQEAIFYRGQWIDNVFRGAFGTALSYEYFLACTFDYQMRYKLTPYTNDTLPEIREGLSQLKADLNTYCESIDVGRLFDLRDTIDQLIIKIHADEADF